MSPHGTMRTLRTQIELRLWSPRPHLRAGAVGGGPISSPSGPRKQLRLAPDVGFKLIGTNRHGPMICSVVINGKQRLPAAGEARGRREGHEISVLAGSRSPEGRRA